MNSTGALSEWTLNGDGARQDNGMLVVRKDGCETPRYEQLVPHGHYTKCHGRAAV